jgi:hypothetical protein
MDSPYYRNGCPQTCAGCGRPFREYDGQKIAVHEAYVNATVGKVLNGAPVIGRLASWRLGKLRGNGRDYKSLFPILHIEQRV